MPKIFTQLFYNIKGIVNGNYNNLRYIRFWQNINALKLIFKLARNLYSPNVICTNNFEK